MSAVVIGLGLAWGTASPVWAQAVPGARPSPALFGGATRGAAHRVTFDSHVAGGAVSVSPGAAGPEAATPDRLTRFGTGSAGLNYAGDWDRFGVFASGVSSVHRFLGRSPSTVATYHASTGARGQVPVGRRTSVLMDGGLAYRPLGVTNLFPDMFAVGQQRLPTEYEFGVSDQHYLSASAGLSIDHALSQRSSVSAGYSAGRSYGTAIARELTTQTVFGRFTRELARGLGMRIGYGRRLGDFGRRDDTRRLTEHNIDVGLDYARALSFSRRTALSFSSGTTAVSDGEDTRFDLVGGATLVREIGRTWTASLNYRRQMSFSEALGDSVFSDGAYGALSGLFGRRVSLSVSAGAAAGALGFDRATDNEFVGYHGSAGVQTAINAFTGINFTYVYYRYRFDRTEALPAEINNRVSRHAALVALDLTLPIFRRTRSVNATR